MKVILILVGVLVVLFIGVQSFFMSAQSGIEKYPYKVKKTYDTFEVREYETTLFTTVKLGTSEYKKASSQGFSILAGYIFGGNETNEKIAMTSPVAMSLEDSMEVMFMVPKGYNKENLPKPNESKIIIKEEPSKIVAAISFTGFANEEKIEKYKLKLIESLKKEGIKFTNRFFFLGYNSPYELTNRLNEVIVELENKQ